MVATIVVFVEFLLALFLVVPFSPRYPWIENDLDWLLSVSVDSSFFVCVCPTWGISWITNVQFWLSSLLVFSSVFGALNFTTPSYLVVVFTSFSMCLSVKSSQCSWCVSSWT